MTEPIIQISFEPVLDAVGARIEKTRELTKEEYASMMFVLSLWEPK